MAHIERNVAARLGRETMEILSAGGYTSPSGRQVDLRDALEVCRAGTVEYPPWRDVPLPNKGSFATRIRVENATVLDVGRRMASGGQTAALNFASATAPGGGFLAGARAQEESIARSSGLYVGLEGREMYAYHRERDDAMHADWVIYSPDVPVFRTDAGTLLERPWTMGIVTCAAAHGAALARSAPERLPEIPAVMTARTRKVLAIVADRGVRRFVLGAWGCGVFGLDPAMIAGIFRDALEGPFSGVFEEVVFAITDWSADRQFIGPFEKAFRRT